MNPVIEEAMTNMIRRIDKIERIIKTFTENPPKAVYDFNPNMASQSQINYLRSLGGKAWNGMSKQEAGKRIDARTKNNKNQIKEPKEVDTEDAGLDGDLI